MMTADAIARNIIADAACWRAMIATKGQKLERQERAKQARTQALRAELEQGR